MKRESSKENVYFIIFWLLITIDLLPAAFWKSISTVNDSNDSLKTTLILLHSICYIGILITFNLALKPRPNGGIAALGCLIHILLLPYTLLMILLALFIDFSFEL